MPSIKELTESLNKVDHDIKSVLDGIVATRGKEAVPTADEQAVLDKMDAESDRLMKQITIEKNAAKRNAMLSQSDGAFTVPADRATANEDGTISIKVGRHPLKLEPTDRNYAAAQPSYSKEFDAYLRSGRPSAGLMVSDNTKGGYLAPTTMMTGMIEKLDDMSVMRSLATVLPPLGPNTSMGAVSWDTDPGDADWTPEVPASAITEDTAARLGKRNLTPHALSKLIKISTTMLQSSVIDIQSYVYGRLAYKFSLPENKAFLTGDGNEKPLGIFTESAMGVPSTQNYSTSSTTGFTGDDLIEAMFALKSGYMDRGTWLFHRATLKKARLLKTGDGQYIWQPGFGSNPATLFGRPYAIDDNAPSTFTAAQPIAMFGDFSYYWIADAFDLQITVLDQPYRTQRQIGYLGEKSTDGMPVLAEAFVRVVTKA